MVSHCGLGGFRRGANGEPEGLMANSVGTKKASSKSLKKKLNKAIAFFYKARPTAKSS